MSAAVSAQPKNAILCCQPQVQSIPKLIPVDHPLHKVVKMVAPSTNGTNGSTNGVNGKHPKSSPPVNHANHVNGVNGNNANHATRNGACSHSPEDVKFERKIIQDENALVKLTDVSLPNISVQHIETKNKTDKPRTTIIIYKSKNGNRPPTAKVIMERVFLSHFYSNFLLHFPNFNCFSCACNFLTCFIP